MKPNNAIGELVEAFVAARPSLMEIARRPVYPGSPKRKREVEDDEEDLYHASPAKKRAAPERNARSTRVTRSTRSTQMVEDSDGEFELIENETYVPGMFNLYTELWCCLFASLVFMRWMGFEGLGLERLFWTRHVIISSI